MAKQQPQVDLSEFFRLSRPKRPPCRIGFAVTQLSAAEVTQLEAACQTDKGIITASAIREWLAARGHESNVSSITSHRARTCTCHDES